MHPSHSYQWYTCSSVSSPRTTSSRWSRPINIDGPYREPKPAGVPNLTLTCTWTELPIHLSHELGCSPHTAKDSVKIPVDLPCVLEALGHEEVVGIAWMPWDVVLEHLTDPDEAPERPFQLMHPIHHHSFSPWHQRLEHLQQKGLIHLAPSRWSRFIPGGSIIEENVSYLFHTHPGDVHHGVCHLKRNRV